jgi:O-Antigen ligase
VIGAILCWLAFYAKGGLKLESTSTAEMALTVGAGVVVAAGIVLARTRGRVYGLWPTGLLLAFAILSALSIVWSVQPDNSWQDSGRLFAYAGVFGASVALAQVVPTRWPAVLGGVTLAAVVVCAYALLCKIFAASLDPFDTFARLNEPYGYWNAVGLTAAMGVVSCMWLGGRRDGHPLIRALAYPATGLLLVTLVLAYSRGALVALVLGLLVWFCAVPLRLRSAALLIVSAVGAGTVVAWDFSRHALSSENVSLPERSNPGHQLGALLLAMLVVLTIAGLAIGFLSARRPPSPLTRRRAGAALLTALALAVLAFAGALAHSQRGFTGTISHDFHALANPNAKQPPNTPGRLTAVASVRARYWKEAFQVFKAHPALGAGAEGFATAHLRYETQTLEVTHAHGFIVQTLADLGVTGLVLALALLFTWMAAAGRPTHPFNRRWTRWHTWLEISSGGRPGWQRMREGELTAYGAERVGMLAMLCVVVTFGVHSLIDWTWYVPADACAALLCAGWLAGRGPLYAPQGETPARVRRPSNLRLVLAGGAIVTALLMAWSQWQPQHSEEARQEALALLARGDRRAALTAADSAVSRDPLSVEALSTLSTVQLVLGEPRLAQATLERAVRLQPSNPQTWMTLGRYELTNNPDAAVKDLQAGIYLDPESISEEAVAAGERDAVEVHNNYIRALEAAARLRTASELRSRAARAGRRAGRPPLGPRSTRSRTGRSGP